jgi:putative serine protease PepD
MLRPVLLLIGLCVAAVAQTTLSTQEIASKTSPAVVLVKGTSASGAVFGSGFIVAADGKIATNLHVIRDIKSGGVQLSSGEIFDSFSVLAFDEGKDLAIIQISGFDLPPVELGNSNETKVGEPVIAVGSPQELQGTVTAGVVSAVREDPGGGGFKAIQTDAAANPGNSGGPLVNSRGQVIGVVSAKLRGSEGLTFAVPINYVRGIMNNLQKPMSLDAMRASLAGAPDVFKSSNYPTMWKSLLTGAIMNLRFQGEYIYAEVVISKEERKLGSFALYELRKQGNGYSGVLRQSVGFDTSFCTNICSFEKPVEFTSVAADRIEGRYCHPLPGARVDCKKCTSSKPDGWQKFTWIPEQ